MYNAFLCTVVRVCEGIVRLIDCVQGYLSVLGYACIGGSADVVRELMIHGNMKSRPSEVCCCVLACCGYH